MMLLRSVPWHSISNWRLNDAGLTSPPIRHEPSSSFSVVTPSTEAVTAVMVAGRSASNTSVFQLVYSGMSLRSSSETRASNSSQLFCSWKSVSGSVVGKRTTGVATVFSPPPQKPEPGMLSKKDDSE